MFKTIWSESYEGCPDQEVSHVFLPFIPFVYAYVSVSQNDKRINYNGKQISNLVQKKLRGVMMITNLLDLMGMESREEATLLLVLTLANLLTLSEEKLLAYSEVVT